MKIAIYSWSTNFAVNGRTDSFHTDVESQVRLRNLTARLTSTALSLLLDELAHRARHIELAGEPRRSTSHLVRGYASLPASLSARGSRVS
ncbi:hypothetical protein [Streptomyces sp. NBC_00986]|uniref:hypothetical protein n=1 Tax=Streptomyces sp. NBC_00986 TaxID=2903702 RepID=UPI003868DC57|nr:hypothetical protein OG504_01755 [Streptomyces sp. NBC_00986]